MKNTEEIIRNESMKHTEVSFENESIHCLEERFRNAYQELTKVIKKRSADHLLTAMGYTSNLDLLCEFRIDILNQLLAEHGKGKKLEEMHAVPMIHTVSELLGTIVYYCIHGIGGEADVADAELVKACFPYRNGMGGTAVQAALALAELKGESLVHLTDDSREVCDILSSPYINVVLEDGTLGHTDCVSQTNPQETHIIIQFKKGDVILLEDQSAVIPCSNRLILTRNTVNEYVPFRPYYFKWIEEHAKQVSSNVLSSFNSILDSAILKERLEYVKNHVDQYRLNNPDGVVYFEDAHYHNGYVRELCAEILYPSVDILSMNEEELEYTLNTMHQVDIDMEDIFSIINGMEFLQQKYHFRYGIIVHTKDYAVFSGEPGRFDIESGLMFGVMLATAKAANGVYGTPEMIQEILNLDMSRKGLYNLSRLKKSPYKDRVILVPTRYIDKPKYTIGLGDSFTGGFQMCFH